MYQSNYPFQLALESTDWDVLGVNKTEVLIIFNFENILSRAVRVGGNNNANVCNVNQLQNVLDYILLYYN